MRSQISILIDREIKEAKKGKPAKIILKLNSLSDVTLVEKLYQAASAGVEVSLIIRGIYSLKRQLKKNDKPPFAISIVDQFLEHGRVMYFYQGGKEAMYISSADWMVRNLDHRVEAACPIYDEQIKNEILAILNIQLSDNVKSRILDVDFTNNYVSSQGRKKIRSQQETYNYLYKKQLQLNSETSSN
jgi:polyphosphate kinase